MAGLFDHPFGGKTDSRRRIGGSWNQNNKGRGSRGLCFPNRTGHLHQIGCRGSRDISSKQWATTPRLDQTFPAYLHVSGADSVEVPGGETSW